MRADLGKQLTVLQEIATTNLKPESQQVVYFVPWEGAGEVVYERKTLKYIELAGGEWLEP